MSDEAYFPSHSKYFALEGLVGCGKTTCLSHLAYENHVCCVPEPVHLFERFQSYNPLALQYSHPLANAVAAQMHIVRMSAAYYRAQIPLEDDLLRDKIILSERSILSPQMFIRANYAQGYFSPFTRDFLLRELENVSVDVRRPDAIIYLDAHPSLCIDRIQNRQRESEVSGDFEDFLEYLLWSHMDLIENVNIPVHMITVMRHSTEEEVADEVKRIIFKELNDNDAEGDTKLSELDA